MTGVRSDSGGGFELDVSGQPALRARHLVISTGAYQKPHLPPGADTLPAQVAAMDVTGYRNVSALPPGDVLIIGRGQTVCQLAEELSDAGRKVVVACGRAPWAPRRIDGRDLLWWHLESGFLDTAAATLPP